MGQVASHVLGTQRGEDKPMSEPSTKKRKTSHQGPPPVVVVGEASKDITEIQVTDTLSRRVHQIMDHTRMPLDMAKLVADYAPPPLASQMKYKALQNRKKFVKTVVKAIEQALSKHVDLAHTACEIKIVKQSASYGMGGDKVAHYLGVGTDMMVVDKGYFNPQILGWACHALAGKGLRAKLFVVSDTQCKLHVRWG